MHFKVEIGSTDGKYMKPNTLLKHTVVFLFQFFAQDPVLSQCQEGFAYKKNKTKSSKFYKLLVKYFNNGINLNKALFKDSLRLNF